MSFKDSQTQSLEPDARGAGNVVALRSTQTGVEHALEMNARRWVIGSSRSCDLVVEDKYVSNTHCVLERRKDGRLIVRDKSSKNGTFVDGNLVEGAELRVGAHLRIGESMFLAVAGGAAGGHQPRAIELLRGHDPVFRATVDQALKVAPADCNVLIVGETGTGKDVLARVIHEASRRQAGKFVPVNCGGIPRELIASELFGHEKGSFTGAHADRDGYFMEASGGTLFLDELGELPLELQPHLLRALETRQVRRVGGTQDRACNVRIISATNRIEHIGTEKSRIRLDLYHRLATVVLRMPPLRERMGDLVDIVEAALVELQPQYGKKRISADGWRALGNWNWPGNVRELRQVINRAVVLGGEELGPLDLFPDCTDAEQLGDYHLRDKRLVPYQAMIRGAMEQALNLHGSIRGAAQHMGMAKSTFAERARAWGLLPRPKNKLGKLIKGGKK
ncbi:MAG TPA: sigma 54-interacting transcriptional regulator [Kofleriaceae bacterium]|nr:sigma 54-interacting transcriptional regulator [Kofleriaceae bacterium]